jgi:hypothetical protein
LSRDLPFGLWLALRLRRDPFGLRLWLLYRPFGLWLALRLRRDPFGLRLWLSCRPFGLWLALRLRRDPFGLRLWLSCRPFGLWLALRLRHGSFSLRLRLVERHSVYRALLRLIGRSVDSLLGRHIRIWFRSLVDLRRNAVLA